MSPGKSPVTKYIHYTSYRLSLKNFQFLEPHLPKLEGDLQSLLYEIDRLIEKKKDSWGKDSKPASVLDDQEKRSKAMPPESNLDTFGGDGLSNVEESHTLKATINWMRRNHESLKQAYDEQIALEKARNRKALHKFEKDNRVLLSELKSLRENNRAKTEVLASQLNEEKNISAALRERCKELEMQLSSCLDDLEKEREAQRKLQSAMHSRQSELDVLLQRTNNTVQMQSKELMHVKRLLATKQSELQDLASTLSTKENDLIATKKIVRRLEKTVSKHLALLSRSPIESLPASPSSLDLCEPNLQQNSTLDEQLFTLDQNLMRAQVSLKEKVKEFSRLQSTCHAASATIRKLSESKLESEQKVSSACRNLKDLLSTTEGIYSCIENIRTVMVTKLVDAEQRIRRLSESVQKLQSKNKPAACSVAVQQVSHGASTSVQTDAEFVVPPDFWPGAKVQLLRNDWLSSVQQLQKKIDTLSEERSRLASQLKQQSVRVEELHKENLALTDLLTDAEQFNRTRISCTTKFPMSNVKSSTKNDLYPSTQTAQSVLMTKFPPPSAETVVTEPNLPPIENSSKSDARSLSDHQESNQNGMHQSPITSPISDTSSFSLSPIEFGDFVLSGGRDHSPPATDPVQPPDFASPVDATCTQTPILRSSDSPSATRRKQHVRFSSDTEILKQDANNSAHDTLQEHIQSAYTMKNVPLPCSSLLLGSTDHGDVTDHEDRDELDDTNIFGLTAKFLASEKQHSSQLERQIDMHLEDLKRQIGL